MYSKPHFTTKRVSWATFHNGFYLVVFTLDRTMETDFKQIYIKHSKYLKKVSGTVP